MNTYKISAQECEHSGDLAEYAKAIRAAGGTITESHINIDAEVGYMTVSGPADFKERLAKQTAFGEPATEWMAVRTVA